MDLLTLQRIELLHPKIRQEVLESYKYINNHLFGKNIRLRFSHTYRSLQEQEELYKQGRSKLYDAVGKPLSRVTNAKAGQSLHNYGLAFDIVVLVDKNEDGIFEAASWDMKADNDKDNIPDWHEAIVYFKQLGYVWGGNWKKFPDYPHFEKTFGHTWQSLYKKYMEGDVFTEEIDGEIYKWVNI